MFPAAMVAKLGASTISHLNNVAPSGRRSGVGPPLPERESELFVNADSVEMKDSRRRSRSPKYSGTGGSDWYDSNGRNSSAMGDGHEEGYRLHVADLHTKATKRDLEKTFGKFGPLREIWMARTTPCFAFVVYKYKDDAEEACQMADGADIQGRKIRVTFALPRTRGRGRKGFDPNSRCYQCGDRGHFSRDCQESKYGYKRPPSPGHRGGGRGGHHGGRPPYKYNDSGYDNHY